MPTTSVLSADQAGVDQAARLLRAGELVVFPTDTVYGVGAALAHPAAVARIYEVKERPARKGFAVFLRSPAEMARVAVNIPPLADALADRCLPGALTLVLWARPDLPEAVTGGQGTVGIRIPDSVVARELGRLVGSPLVVTSANRSGQPSPVTAQEALAQLGGRVPLLLDGGACSAGRESTVVDLTGPGPRIVREGAIPRATLEAVWQAPTAPVPP